jgi:hypothetical protein
MLAIITHRHPACNFRELIFDEGRSEVIELCSNCSKMCIGGGASACPSTPKQR